MKKKLFSLIVFVTFICVNCFNVSVAEALQPNGIDDSQLYSIGFTELKGGELSKENQYLANSIPLLLMSKLQDIRYHKLSEEEKKAYVQTRKKNSLQKKGEEIASLQNQRDQLIFTQKKKITREEKYQTLTARLEAAQKEYREIKKETRTLSEDSTEWEINFHGKNREGELLPYPYYPLQNYAEKEGVSLLFYGEIDQVQDYIYVNINVWNAIIKQKVIEFTDASSREHINLIVDQAKEVFTQYLLGREYASLHIQVSPPKAFIKVRDKLLGVGEADASYIMPGDMNVRVSYPGYLPEERQFSLKPNEQKNLYMELKKIERRGFTLKSDPPDVDVYMDSHYLGKTPLEIHPVGEKTIITMKKTGYRNVQFYAPLTGGTIEKKLPKEIVNWEKKLEESRRSFYSAFGHFILSLSIPLLTYGYYQNHYSILQSGRIFPNENLWDKHYRRGLLGYYSYWGGILISTTLFVRMGYTLMDYIEVGEAYHF